jgi:N-methylhydantoinase A/oxoprolinase/acetone carboxylase beta subunit
MPSRQLLVDDIRIRAIAKTGIEPKTLSIRKKTDPSTSSKISNLKNVYFDTSYMQTNLHLYEDLCTGDVIHGPAIVIDKNW